MFGSLSIIGGDLRQVYLRRLFEADGIKVYSCLNNGCSESDIDWAMSADAIILPVPLSRDGVHLYAPTATDKLPLNCMYRKLPDTKPIFGLPSDAAEQFGLKGYSYALREDFALANALPTVEGAIMLAINSDDGVLCGAECLVLGYGRIGRMLATRLHALGAKVCVAARRHDSRVEAASYGYSVADFNRLSDYPLNQTLIFNTVPNPLPECILERMSGSTVIELASAPYCMSAQQADRYSVRLIMGGGLPGKVAPRYAAGVIYSAIKNTITEELL